MIATKLRQVEVRVGQGIVRVNAIGEGLMAEQTLCRWRLRPPPPEALVPMDQTPAMHRQSTGTPQAGLINEHEA